SYITEAVRYIDNKEDVIIHTSRGNDDERVKQSDEVFKARGVDKSGTSLLYGTLLGQISRRVAERTSLKRIIIAGGDTSSHAARAMGIEAVEMIAPLAPGAPLCKAYAPGSAIDGLEVNFKGGQVGKEDYFEMVKGYKL
ncbi:MAG: nucleotide-binding domain containing protein, partial [Sphingobacteriaceae bacterium]